MENKPCSGMQRILKTILLILGLVWAVGAFAAYYRIRPLHLLIIELNWKAIGLPWLEEMQRGWQGVPWEVVVQGGLLVWIAAVVGILGWWVGRKLMHVRDAHATAGKAHWQGAHAAEWGAAVWGSGLVLGALGMVVFVLGVLGALQPARVVFGSLLLVMTVGAVYVVLQRAKVSAKGCTGGTPALLGQPGLFGLAPLKRLIAGLSLAEKMCVAVVVILEAGFLLYALTPSMQSDELRYHLAAPQEWLKAGRLAYLPYNAFSNFPSVIEMLFLFGLGLAGDLLAKGFHFLFLPLTTAAIALLARGWHEVGCADEAHIAKDYTRWRIRPSVMASAVWATSPIVLPLAGWAFIDLGVLFFTLGIICFLMRWGSGGLKKDWVVAAIFGGLLVGSKYTGIITVMFGALLMVVFAVRREGLFKSIQRALVFGMIAATIASPWWIKNVIYTGNPVYPLAHSIFDGGEWRSINAEIYGEKLREKGEGRGFLSFVKLPWTTATNPLAFGASEIGPLYWVFAPWIIISGLVILVPRWRRYCGAKAMDLREYRIAECWIGCAMLALWGMFFLVYWFFTYQDNRFLLPFLAVATVGIAKAFAVGEMPWLARRGSIRASGSAKPLPERFFSGILLAVFLAIFAYNSLDNLRWLVFRAGQGISRWPAYTLGFMSRGDYLAANLNYYRIAEYCTKSNQDSDRVLLVGEHRKMHWGCNVDGSDWYDLPRILPYLERGDSADAILDTLIADGITDLFFNLEEWGWPSSDSELSGSVPSPPGSAWAYNRRFLSPPDIQKIQGLLGSPRLPVRLAAMPGRIFLTRILPRSPSISLSEPK